jgi:hypothetical protein
LIPTQGNLGYTYLGEWSEWTDTVGLPQNEGVFLTGFQTPVGNVPTSGTATYGGAGTVLGRIYLAGNSAPPATAGVLGDSSFSVNFATGAITGSFTNMNSGGPWNTVSVAANISGNAFAGTTAANATTGNYAFGNSSGVIQGGFYGPAANEIGAIWTLTDGANYAAGVVGAPKTAAPSDRRLKRDIRRLGKLSNGLQLYRYRYLGGERGFTGVMAQDLLADPRFRDAVISGDSGFLWVDYGRLGLDPPDLDGMIAAGRCATRALQAARC